jgi:mono/diheme cytochrome c family protein
MKTIGTLCGIAAALLLAGIALGQARPSGGEFGKREFEAKCAACHGTDGRGEGVHKPFLETSPTDLTELSKAHGGEFPYMHFYAVVDGRFERGESDMPCFADVYLTAAAEDYMDVEYNPDRYLDTRLTALAMYVAELQEK